MPAYSFNKMFVPFVQDGSKAQTVRARRKKGYARPGDPLFLYFGLRTKHCFKIREEICRHATTIHISEKNIIIYTERLGDVAADTAIRQPLHPLLKKFIGITLDRHLMNRFAWNDGFRPARSTEQKPGRAFDLMISFWRKTHSLPWVGDVIYWDPTPENNKPAE